MHYLVLEDKQEEGALTFVDVFKNKVVANTHNAHYTIINSMEKERCHE